MPHSESLVDWLFAAGYWLTIAIVGTMSATVVVLVAALVAFAAESAHASAMERPQAVANAPGCRIYLIGQRADTARHLMIINGVVRRSHSDAPDSLFFEVDMAPTESVCVVRRTAATATATP